MEDDQQEEQPITWNTELETLLAAEGEKALGCSWIHGQAEAWFARRNQWITIPCVVLSTLSGSASVGSTTMFEDAKTASLSIGAVSIFVGILQTLGSFWSFAKHQESHRLMDVQWAKLHRFIAVEMTLPRAERIQARDMLKIVRETIERLAETAPLVPDEIIHAFTKKFGKAYPDVAVPDMANGLKKIRVNSRNYPHHHHIEDGGSHPHSVSSPGLKSDASTEALRIQVPQGEASASVVGVVVQE